ncbi:MAG: hypothetical protein AAF717_02305 [Bacteroidota bacterium]
MKSRAERIATIENSIESSNKTKKVPWKEENEYFPVIRIDSEMLMYRIENSRTTRQQQAYLAQHNLNGDFFSDPESVEVQNAQHEILLKMAKSQKGFIDDLRKRKQDDELIITRDGYIVNGNRRTSALRELGTKHFNCAVLPKDTTAKDIYALEQELQISTDFRLDYDWVNELNNIRQGLLQFGFSEKQLYRNLRITPQSLKTKLRIISLVDQFLEWKNQPKNYAYEKLDKLQQGFEDLEKGMKKFVDYPAKQELFRNEVFQLMDNPPGKGEGRLYDHIRKLVAHFDNVQDKLGTTVVPPNGQQTKIDDQQDDFLGDIMGDVVAEETVSEFANPEEGKVKAKRIYEAISDAISEHKDTKNAEAIYDSAKDALRALSGLIVDQNTSKKKEAVDTLKKVIEAAQVLIEELGK